ncbi:MAG: hypothetical protein JNL17_02450 [Cyclobacteriaceae bacterium]|nr:hypothetical protein [Cyclobacteriaceae bacterium]
MKFFFILQMVFMLSSLDLFSQPVPSAQSTIIYRVVSLDHSSTLSFFSSQDTVHFKAIERNKKRDQPNPFLIITQSTGHAYSVITYFSGFGYHISTLPDDSLVITYGDMPYGELIINGLSTMDQLNNSLHVNRLNCIVSINGVKGKPKLDLGGNTLDTERLHKPPVKDILVTNVRGDRVFCSAKREFSNTTGATFYTLQLSEINSKALNEHFKIALLYILWLYENAK